jgi:DNA-directed RNA polymerase subunit M/transcription elongation factor TFIIS
LINSLTRPKTGAQKILAQKERNRGERTNTDIDLAKLTTIDTLKIASINPLRRPKTGACKEKEKYFRERQERTNTDIHLVRAGAGQIVITEKQQKKGGM